MADLEGVLGVPWNPPFDRTTIVHVLQADSVLVLIATVWFQLCTCIVAAEQTCLIFGDKFSAVNQLQGLGIHTSIHFLGRAAYFVLYKPHPPLLANHTTSYQRVLGGNFPIVKYTFK